ncbi:UNVERIFIED_CONTAM: hypothetical protein Cloal_1810 [Acetivibrio alkalicellulosi]
MFKTNNNHYQVNMLETIKWMDDSLKNKLEKSWVPVFYEHNDIKILLI